MKSGANLWDVINPVFLSHSSKDHDLLPKAAFVLQNSGARVYIDDNDSNLTGADIPTIATQLRISVKKKCQKFVLFLTERVKDSKWIPWELGIADGCISETNVALFPAAEKAVNILWTTMEYMGLYKRIIFDRLEGFADYVWVVYDYHTNTGELLSKWLSRRN